MIEIRAAESESDIKKCFKVMKELRPHIKDENEFYTRVENQQEIAGYFLIFLSFNKEIVSVAGCRMSECLAWGKFLYVDDLCTSSKYHSKGYGQKLFDFLVDIAKENSCDQFHLDSGVQRFGAHKFYLQKNMKILGHHFAMEL